jgi:hypothetical protein
MTVGRTRIRPDEAKEENMIGLSWQSTSVFIIVGLLAGCGDDGNECPEVSGTWKIEQHCQADLVDQTFTVTQEECAFTLSEPFQGWQGTLTSSGEVTVGGTYDQIELNCTGTATSDTLSGDCTPTCPYKYIRTE